MMCGICNGFCSMPSWMTKELAKPSVAERALLGEWDRIVSPAGLSRKWTAHADANIRDSAALIGLIAKLGVGGTKYFYPETKVLVKRVEARPITSASAFVLYVCYIRTARGKELPKQLGEKLEIEFGDNRRFVEVRISELFYKKVSTKEIEGRYAGMRGRVFKKYGDTWQVNALDIVFRSQMMASDASEINREKYLGVLRYGLTLKNTPKSLVAYINGEIKSLVSPRQR